MEEAMRFHSQQIPVIADKTFELDKNPFKPFAIHYKNKKRNKSLSVIVAYDYTHMTHLVSETT